MGEVNMAAEGKRQLQEGCWILVTSHGDRRLAEFDLTPPFAFRSKLVLTACCGILTVSEILR